MTGRDDLWRLHAAANPGIAIYPQRLGRPVRVDGARHPSEPSRRTSGAGLGRGAHHYADGYRTGRENTAAGLHTSHPRGTGGPPAGGGGGGGGGSGCGPGAALLLLLWPLLVIFGLMARHRAPDPQPGDPDWSHPHVRGETDPAERQQQAEQQRRRS